MEQRSHPRVALAATSLLTALLVAALVLPASAYIKQRVSQVLLSGPNVVRCDRTATIKAKVVLTKSGKPVNKQIINWSLAQKTSSGDRLSEASTITNANGRTSVTLSFGPASGPRVVQASIAGGAPTITVRCAGGLPKTSTARPSEFAKAEVPLAASLPSVTTSELLPATHVRLQRLGIDLPLVEGDGTTVPQGAASHYPGTAWPGQGSNTYLYAHAREGDFLELWQVRRGDQVDVELADGSVATYVVTVIDPLAPWDALEYLSPTDHEILTLQTCLTYDETAPRFVVIAERVASA